LGQNILQVLVVGFDGLHRIVDGLADVRTFRQVEQRSRSGRIRAGRERLCLIVGLADGAASAALAGDLRLGLANL
jgi:hypothetical protein